MNLPTLFYIYIKKGQEEEERPRTGNREENDSRNIKEKEKEIAKFIRKRSIYLVNFTALTSSKNKIQKQRHV